eukprot:jgi/Tetstr1/447222/TSEL_034659.t1
MDYATPSLLGVLAFLGIMIYARLGRLRHASKQACDTKVHNSHSRAHDVQMYALTAKQSDDRTIVIKKEGHGLDFLNAVRSEKVDEIIVKGRAFAVTFKMAASQTFEIEIDEANARSPFLKIAGAQADRVLTSDQFGTVYVMAH